MKTELYLFPFEKLDVWQKAIELADDILRLLEPLPLNRHTRLIAQLEGAVASISQNIAEGKGRQHKKEFLQYLAIAQGSLYETISLCELFRRRAIFSPEHFISIRSKATFIDRKLHGLMNSIRGIGRGERSKR